MTEYINSWKNYANFTARTTVRGFWMSFLFHFIASMIINILVFILEMAIYDPTVTIYQPFAVTFVWEGRTGLYIRMFWFLAYALPLLAIQIRRLRDAGKHWTYIFIILIPLIGGIRYIDALRRPSIEDNGLPVV